MSMMEATFKCQTFEFSEQIPIHSTAAGLGENLIFVDCCITAKAGHEQAKAKKKWVKFLV